MKFKIGKNKIGDNEKCFIIAEIGSNHDGSLKKAKKMIDLALKAGSDAVKLQQFHADNLIVKEISKKIAKDIYGLSAREIKKYSLKNGKVHNPFYDLVKNNEVPDKWIKELVKYAKKKGIIVFSSVWDKHSVDICEKAKVDAYKIGSGEITNIPLLKHVAKTKKPIILSTGMAYHYEIKKAIKAIRSKGNNKIALLHCIVNYPCDSKDASINYIKKMKKMYDYPVGYSDHVIDNSVSLAATALGAKIIEKHVTFSRKSKGPDHKFAITFEELNELVSGIRIVEGSLGSEEYIPSVKERKRVRRARKCAYALRDLKKGEILNVSMFRFVRPAIAAGISPDIFEKFIGRKLMRNISEFEMIRKVDIR